MNNAGEKLKALRESLAMTQEQVAQELGISRSALNAYELNLRTPRDDTKVAISQFYKTPVQVIFFDNE